MYTVFPTGTTIYKPEKCFNGYTLYPSMKHGVGAQLIDMNGNVVRSWPEFDGFMINLLPEGRILGGKTGREFEPMLSRRRVTPFKSSMVRRCGDGDACAGYLAACCTR